jgi:hypothetical protein
MGIVANTKAKLASFEIIQPSSSGRTHAHAAVGETSIDHVALVPRLKVRFLLLFSCRSRFALCFFHMRPARAWWLWSTPGLFLLAQHSHTHSPMEFFLTKQRANGLSVGFFLRLCFSSLFSFASAVCEKQQAEKISRCSVSCERLR